MDVQLHSSQELFEQLPANERQGLLTSLQADGWMDWMLCFMILTYPNILVTSGYHMEDLNIFHEDPNMDWMLFI